MKKIGVLPNILRDINLEYTKDLVQWLMKKNVSIAVLKEYENLIPNVNYATDIKNICESSDFVVSLGGDGTILDKAEICASCDTPLIGINLGGLGYMTDGGKIDGKVSIQKVLDGEFGIEKRMMIETTIEGTTYKALNDVCVTKGEITKMINFDISVNGKYIDSYRADGVIISTPSGSTAYNISAGGPVLKPDLDAIVITPISSHKLYSRSIVVSGDDEVFIDLKNNSNAKAFMSADGKDAVEVNGGVKIVKSDKKVQIIKTTDVGFYDVLREKLSV